MKNENQNDIIVYRSHDGKFALDINVSEDNVWLTRKQIADLFQVEKQDIDYHISNIFKSQELSEDATTKEFLVVQNEGNRSVKRNIEHYNLDMIISIGYRVNSLIATRFRQWATQTLKEYMVKGFAMDDERLKSGGRFGKDYFRELLERIRSIRASERRIYQQITDIFAECSIDYDPNSQVTKNFYATVQNKFHYAITGQTAAEIIHSKADSTKENMGLLTWKNSPDGRILKPDAKVAKNYLDEKQIKRLERTISGYFDYLENIIERGNTFTMEALAESVNKFLSFNEYKVLEGKGIISKETADKKAVEEYDKFNKNQKIISDFDKQIRKLGKNNEKD